MLNACAFARIKDDRSRNDIVDIAIKTFEIFQSSVPDYGKPDHTTYATMLMIFNNHVPTKRLRSELCKNIFHQCCQNGHLSGYVVAQLQKAVSNKLLRELFGDAAYFNGETVRIDKRRVPHEWRKHGDVGRKSSRKRPSNQVTKQRIQRA